MKRIMPVDYTKSETPLDYHCDGCKAHGVKLWRDYQTFADRSRLLCADCAEVDQRKLKAVEQPNPDPDWTSPYSRGEGDQIGWLIPAVPTEATDKHWPNTFWGYTSVPAAACQWWRALPDRRLAR